MHYSVAHSWESLPESALSLLKSRDDPYPFSGALWFSLFSRYVAPGQGEIRWLILHHENETLLLLPMLEYQDGKRKVLKSLSNHYTPYFTSISAGLDDAQLLELLIKLAKDFLKQFDEIDIYPLTLSPLNAFLSASKGRGFFTESYIKSYNWRRREIASFEEYWSGINSRLKHTVKRKQKKFDAEGGIQYSIVRYEDVEKALTAYHEVYLNSWKPAESHPEFISELVRQYSKKGKLRMGFIHKNGAPIATQIWVVSNGTAYIYKLAYDPDYAKKSVGTLLSRYMFETIITADSIHTVDYLTGDDAYKADWMDSRRELYGFKCHNLRTARGLVSSARSLAGRFYKTLFRW